MAAWVLIGTGCGDDAPPPGVLDGSTGQDGSAPLDAPPLDVSPRGPDPRLPAADIEITLPYLGAPVQITRRVGATTGQMDLHFNVDTTSSLRGEINTLQAELADRIIPMVEAQIDDVAFGVSHFEDFPTSPFGASGDTPFELLTPITKSRSRLASGVQALGNLGNGNDVPESGFESLYQLATGDGLRQGGFALIESNDDGVGGVAFRPGALHVVVHATDAPSHRQIDYRSVYPGAHSRDDAVAALAAIDAKVLGIVSSEPARSSLLPVVQASGAVVPAEDGACFTGIDGEARSPDSSGACALVFDIGGGGEGLSNAIVTAIVDLLDSIAFSEVFGEAREDPFAFLRTIEAVSAEAEGEPPERRDLRPVDGLDDTFIDVRFGTELEFELEFQNLSLPGADYDQVFRMRVEIMGDEQLLDTLTVRVIVPAMRDRLDAGMPDGGATDAGIEIDGGVQDVGPDVDDAGLDSSDV